MANKSNSKYNKSPNPMTQGQGKSMRGKQGRKDSRAKRVNFDNERESKFERTESIPSRGRTTGASNDVRWYAHTPELLRSAASLPYSETVGMPTPWKDDNSIPGVLSIYWDPVIGNQAALNQAANMTYSNTVHANSRNTKYDAPDEMLVILAGAEVFSTIAEGIRIYGLARQYSQQNYYTPDALITALGFDPANVRANLANMWFDLNEMISRASQLWIPNEFPLIERRFWMNSNVYTDAQSVKAQYYVYVQRRHYIYVEKNAGAGASLKPYSGWSNAGDGGALHTWAQYKSLVNAQFQALLDSQDRGIIFGDILKAYGSEKLYKIANVSSEYMVVPTYDPEVLTQIENSVGVQNSYDGIISMVEPNVQLANGWATSSSINYSWFTPAPQVLNFHQVQVPTPEQNMVATRIKAGATYNHGNNVSVGICGTELVHHYGITCWEWNSTSGRKAIHQSLFTSVMLESALTGTLLWQWVSFDWAPWIYVLKAAPTIPEDNGVFTITPDYVVGDYDNYTTVDDETMRKMDTTAIYSELGVPSIL